MDGTKRILIAGSPAAAAILVFGVIYGSLAGSRLGFGATITSSLFVFSGAVQFTVVALVASGAGAAALIVGATMLNLRNLVLGAVLRPRVNGSKPRRAAMGWFLTDEATGLALTARGDASRVLWIAGSMFYVAWQVGTLLGLLGASVDALQDAATAVFPVLFVALSSVACSSWSIALRTLAAAAVAALAAWLWPASQALVAVVAAVAVSIPGRDS